MNGRRLVLLTSTLAEGVFFVSISLARLTVLCRTSQHYMMNSIAGGVENSTLEFARAERGVPLSDEEWMLLRHREEAWARLRQKSATVLRASLTVNTDVVLGHALSVRASLVRPSVVSRLLPSRARSSSPRSQPKLLLLVRSRRRCLTLASSTWAAKCNSL